MHQAIDKRKNVVINYNFALQSATGKRRRTNWNWTTSVWYLLILEFKLMKLNLILLPQLLCATRSLVVYISASLWLSTHKTLVYSICVSQGSVVTRLRCGGIFQWKFYSTFSAECVSERILKIRRELTTLSIWAWCTTFFVTLCMCVCMYVHTISKNCQCYFLNNSMKHWPIKIIFWHEETWRIWLWFCPPHFNTVATLPCEMQKS